MKLFYAPGTCAMAAWMALEWIGQPYETHEVNIHGDKSPELLEHNPLGAVPTLEDQGWWLTQNAAVLNYLIDSYPEADIGGDRTARGRAEIDRWIGMVNSDMHPVFKPFFGATAYLEDEAMIEKTKKNARELLLQRFAIVDKHLQGRKWLASENHSVADAYFFITILWAEKLGIDLSHLKEVQAFNQRMKADPGVQHVLAACA